ncbi:hypothetical protein JXB41_09090 [Candidatus Woesearchaeota archaeon]|nr:hypothetical protein [Candidatus Woesearchaeota archaeon]
MKKRAQLTLMIIMGLVILLVVVVVVFNIYFSGKRQIINEQPDDIQKLSPVKNYVEQCLQTTAKQALIKLGKQGRIYPSLFLQSDDEIITYFYYRGEGFFPASIDVLEQDVSTYIEQNIGYCINDFSLFAYEINHEKENMNILTNINEKDVTVLMKYPLTVDFDDTQLSISDFNVKLNLNFLDIYELANEIFTKTMHEPEWIDIEFLSKQAYEIRLIRINSNTLVYEINDKKGIDGEDFIYRFAMKYVM